MRRESLRESDLRSLERRSMYSIFAPLDANERLPRELLMEARRHRPLRRRELAAALWLPALFVILFIAGSIDINGLLTLGVVGMLFLALCAFAVSDRP
jgi:hypothetical protein